MIPTKTLVYTADEAQEACAVWQQRLRLMDWHILVKIKREREFSRSERAAEVGIDWPHKESEIYLLDPLDYPPTCFALQDHEFTLVHELLHIHMNAIHDDPDLRALEQAINSIAGALV